MIAVYFGLGRDVCFRPFSASTIARISAGFQRPLLTRAGAQNWHSKKLPLSGRFAAESVEKLCFASELNIREDFCSVLRAAASTSLAS